MDDNRFITIVEERAAVDRDEAERATRSTLQTLAERISKAEARDLVEQLPPQIGPLLFTDHEAERFDVDEFVRRVAEREQVDVRTAERDARAVFSALAQAVDSDEFSDIVGMLSQDFALLLPGGPNIEMLDAEQFVGRVADRVRASVDVARGATEAVLETLAEHIAPGEVDDLIARLPIGLHMGLKYGKAANNGQAKRMKPDRFVAKIAQREGVTPLDAVVHARAVFITLREAIGDDEFFDITSQLDPDYDALWLRR